MSAQPEPEKHPTVTEHPEQRRQEETGHEDASDPREVGRPPSSNESRGSAKEDDAA
jgi:hypothetical protein